jgi:hypothetical protein
VLCFPFLARCARSTKTAHVWRQILRMVSLLPARKYAIAFNPFQKPGQRWMPCIRLPNLQNGFTIIVVSHSASEAKSIRIKYRRPGLT